MKKLNKNDNKLIGFCKNTRRSVNEISRYLSISPASVSVRVKQLQKDGVVMVEREGKGKKTFVRSKEGIKTKQHFITMLKEIKKRGGVTEEEYSTLLPFDKYNPEEYDRLTAILTLAYHQPKLIRRKIFITKAGEKYIQENDKKK